MGRTNKLVDGCYSFWQAGAFPLLAALLKHQQGLRQGTTAGKERAPTAAAAARVAALLLGASGKAAADAGDGGGSSGDGSSSEGGEGDTLTEFVADLPTLNPLEAAQRRRAELQRQLDSAVEASIDAEDRYRAAAGVAAGGPLQQEALAALERASDLQKVRVCGPAASKTDLLPNYRCALNMCSAPFTLVSTASWFSLCNIAIAPCRRCRAASSMSRLSPAARQPCWAVRHTTASAPAAAAALPSRRIACRCCTMHPRCSCGCSSAARR